MTFSVIFKEQKTVKSMFEIKYNMRYVTKAYKYHDKYSSVMTTLWEF